MTVALEWTPRTAARLHTAPSGDAMLVFDPGADVIHELNSTAAFVFARCTGAFDLADIATEYSVAFGCDAAAAARDTRQVLCDLAKAGLLEAEAS